MAKKIAKETFSHAIINTDDMTISEISKDDCKIYSLQELLERWNGVSDVSITISQTSDVDEEVDI